MKTTIDHAKRYGVEYLAPKTNRWLLLGTVGSRDQAERWQLRFAASGTFRIRTPKVEVQR